MLGRKSPRLVLADRFFAVFLSFPTQPEGHALDMLGVDLQVSQAQQNLARLPKRRRIATRILDLAQYPRTVALGAQLKRKVRREKKNAGIGGKSTRGA